MQFGRMYRRGIAAGLVIALGSASSAGALVEPVTDDPVITDTTIENTGTGDARVIPLSDTVASVSAGESQWIAINWTSLDGDARELKVTAVGSEGVIVGYPAFPVDGYSSGYWDDTLTQSETDFTSLKLSVRDDAPTPRSLSVTVSYVSDTGAKTDTFEMPFGTGDAITSAPTPTTAVPTTEAQDPSDVSVTEAPSTTPTTAVSTTAAPTTAVPTTAAPTTEISTTEPAAPLPEVFSFKLVNTQDDVDIAPLADGDVIDIGELGNKISVVAIANDVTESVRFRLNGSNHRVEQYVPYAVAGDLEGDYAHWKPKPGTYEIHAIPFSEDDAAGVEGIAQTITITVVR